MKKILLTAVCLCFVSAANSFAQTDTVSTVDDKFDISSVSLYVPGYFNSNAGVTPFINVLFDKFPDAYDTNKNTFRLSLLELSNAYYFLNPGDANKAANYAAKVLENQQTFATIINSVKTNIDIAKTEKTFDRNENFTANDFRAYAKEKAVEKYCPFERVYAHFACPDTFLCKNFPVPISEHDKKYLCSPESSIHTSSTSDGKVKMYFLQNLD